MATKVETAAGLSTTEPESAAPPPTEDGKSKVEKHEKPEKPDEEQFRADVAAAEQEHGALMEKLNAVKSKIDLAKPSSKGSPAQQRQQDLRSQLSSLRQQQQQLKSSKGHLQEKIKQLDSTLKSRMTEQKNARARVPFKNVEEIDGQIARLEKQVDTGTMKLVDEKKALAEASSLRKQRKGFTQFDEAEKGITDIKAQVAELRKALDDPEAKAMSERYTAIAKELDDLKAEQDEAYKGLNSLRDERTKLHAEQQEKYGAIRAIKDRYYAQKKAYADYEHEAYKARKEKQRAQRDAYEKERRKKMADQRLEEASQPAYMDQILTAEGLIRYFDRSSTGASTSSPVEPGKLAAQASRTVAAGDLKGVKVVRKDEREDNYFMGGGGKKNKKGRKNGANTGPGTGTASPTSGTGTATPTEGAGATGGKFNLSVGVIEELGKVDIEPPMGQADVPGVVEKLKAKLERWKKDQDRQTKANIEKAQKEIDRLEAESHEFGSGAVARGNDTDGTDGIKTGRGGSSRTRPPREAKESKETTDTARKPALINSEASSEPLAPAGSSVDGGATAQLMQEKDAVNDAAEELRKASIEDDKGDRDREDERGGKDDDEEKNGKDEEDGKDEKDHDNKEEQEEEQWEKVEKEEGEAENEE